jgi:hypothetical protein
VGEGNELEGLFESDGNLAPELSGKIGKMENLRDENQFRQKNNIFVEAQIGPSRFKFGKAEANLK